MTVYHTQAESKIFEIIDESVRSLGFEIVRVKNFQLGRNKTLQIMIDRVDQANVSIEDCEKVSRHVSALIDVEDVMDNKYNLEVSSPGLNRPLTRMKDFEKNIGNLIKFQLFEPIEGRRRFLGKLTEIKGDGLIVLLKDLTDQVNLNFNNIEEAFLQYFDSNINSNTK